MQQFPLLRRNQAQISVRKVEQEKQLAPLIEESLSNP